MCVSTFDGVLHDHAHPAPGKVMGPPIEGARDAVALLVRQGHKLTIHTARVTYREQATHIYDWLDYFGFPRGILVLPQKPVADVYVDDRGLRFATWPVALVQLANLERGLDGR